MLLCQIPSIVTGSIIMLDMLTFTRTVFAQASFRWNVTRHMMRKSNRRLMKHNRALSSVCENGKNFCMSHPSRALLSFFATLSMSSKIILCCSRTKLQRSTKYTTLFHHRALTFVWDFHYQILHIHKLAELIGANKRSEKEFHGSLSHMSRISTAHWICANTHKPGRTQKNVCEVHGLVSSRFVCTRFQHSPESPIISSLNRWS